MTDLNAADPAPADALLQRSIYRGGATLATAVGALPTAAQRSLVRAATGPVDSIEAAMREWRSLVDLSGPIDGGSYRLLPTVFHRLQAAGLDDPDRGMLKGIYRRSMVENTRVLDAATPALTAFQNAGITPWLTKGAALTQAGYYPTLASRPMSDVDIVVDASERGQAITVLRSAGFAPLHTDREMSIVHGAGFVDSTGIELDLHWHFLKHARVSAADDVIRRNPQRADVNGVEVQVPGAAGLLIAVAVHGMAASSEPPVRWLVDAAMILDHRGDEIVWADVVEFATRFRLARRLERALAVLAETTGRVAPADAVAALAATPTATVEFVERRIATAPLKSIQGSAIWLFAAYAGGDRELRHVVTGMPRYLAQVWNLDSVRQVPATAARKLFGRLRRVRR